MRAQTRVWVTGGNVSANNKHEVGAVRQPVFRQEKLDSLCQEVGTDTQIRSDTWVGESLK